MIKVLVLKNDSKVLVTKIREVQAIEIGEPNCELEDPVEFRLGEEDWKDRSKVIQRNPVVAEGNEVYASFESKDTNEDGNEVRWWTVERFIFNDSGQIIHHGDINEDLLIAQQIGYKLSK